jgi:formylglycine-generating enzyme required for sulfatase activity
LSLVFASQLAKFSSPHRSIVLLGQLIEMLTEDTLGLSVVVSECLDILQRRGQRLRKELEGKFLEYCLSAIEREVSVRERFQLALALGRLGDPRIVTDLRDPAAYMEIPRGIYRIGDNELHKRNAGLAERRLRVEEPFLVSRFAVTNCQYNLFIEEGGYQDRQFWSDEGWKWRENNRVVEPQYWRDAKWNAPNKPIVGISYWEAEAFAKWTGGFLPEEANWELAARGGPAYVYPWGNDWNDGICNTAEADLRETSPVGIFPRSVSADFALVDMSGNVWE